MKYIFTLAFIIHCTMHSMALPEYDAHVNWRVAFKLEHGLKRFPLSKKNKPDIYREMTQLTQEMGLPIQSALNRVIDYAAINTRDDLTLFCDTQYPTISAEEKQKYTDQLETLNRLESQLIAAAKSNDVGAVSDLLIQGARVNAHDNNGQTALIWAAFYVHKEIVELLMQQPTIDVNAHDNHSNTALILAACYGHKEIVKLLLQQPTIDVNARTIFGGTALILAKRNDHTEIVELLNRHPSIQ